MVIKGAKVYTENHVLEECDIVIKGRRIQHCSNQAAAAADEKVLEASGLYAIPGLVDIGYSEGTAKGGTSMEQLRIAFVGAGGKTTRIHQMAEACHREGKKVLIVTTTHMYREPGMVLLSKESDAEEFLSRVRSCLKENGICVAGLESSDKRKFTALPEVLFRQISELADVVLTEADGSRQLPLKFPGEGEPVLPDELTGVQIIMGREGIGQKAVTVLHRQGLAEETLGITKDTIMTEALVRALFDIYRKKIALTHPDIWVKCFLAENRNGVRSYEEQ